MKDPKPEVTGQPDITPGQFGRALLGMLASTRTAVVLLGVIAAATVLGTILPNPVALKYVYGRLWFHVLLGLLGLNLAACMVWRRRLGLARAWSLFTHAGILLVLLGALVTLVSSERGWIQLAPGMKTDRFLPEGHDAHAHGHEGEPLGFTFRLKDFRLAFHPPVDRLYAASPGLGFEDVRVPRGGEVEIPGAGFRVARATFTPSEEPGVVEFMAPGGERRSVPAKVGTTQELDGEKLALRILRYEPSFIIKKSADGKKMDVGSRGVLPDNPAVYVAVVRGGKPQKPQWLFAKMPEFGRMHSEHAEKGEGPKLDLRFMHPWCPRLEADLVGAGDTRRVSVDSGGEFASPWAPGVRLRYARDPLRIREYESEVELLDGDRVARSHVIRVNSPLVETGTKLSQNSCYWMGGPVTVLGVSRDSGAWFVYAGFVAGIVGTMGRFYVAPLLKRLRARRGRKDGEPQGS